MSVFRPSLFKNCVAIVTGGGTGLGRAISYELLTLGCKVVIASRNMERLSAAATDLSSIGDVTAIPCNIRKEIEVKSLIEATISKYGKLDFLVNNAGGQFIAPLKDVALKGWSAVIETNLTGAFLMSREAYNQWFKENGGSIVNMSANVVRGVPLSAPTGAARAAVENLTKTMAVEWAGSGVRVNGIAPGLVETSTATAHYSQAFDIFGFARKNNPCHRAGVPEEVSGAVAFLLSPAASFISGTTLQVDCAANLYSPLLMTIDAHDKLPPHKWIPSHADCVSTDEKVPQAIAV